MKSLDVKSFVIGILATALVAVALGADRETQAPQSPRYQISYADPQHILVLDNQTSRATVLFRKPVENVAEWPWTNDYSFSLDDALNKPEGASALIGPGHPH